MYKVSAKTQESSGDCSRVNRKWDYLEIKKATGLPDRDINAAIGWLAREGKLTIDETKVGRRNIIYIELNYYIG